MKLYTLLIAFFICNLTMAQDWDLGVKGGINISSASIKNSSADLSSSIGIHLGGYGNTFITDQVSVQPEVLFSLQGWESSTAGNRTLSYLAVPVAVKYYMVEQFNVHAGPQMGFLVHAEDGLDEKLTSVDFSLLVGTEYQINDQIGVGIRYNLGLNNVINNPESNVEVRSRVFQISCKYRLTR